MKKVKFMLLSLALIAVVGGALAFKAKQSIKFCTTKAVLINGVTTCKDASNVILPCPNLTTAVTTAGGNSATFYCTTPSDGTGCNALNCEVTTRQTKATID